MSAALKVELGRRYRFAAAHRLHSPELSEEENFRIFATILTATGTTMSSRCLFPGRSIPLRA